MYKRQPVASPTVVGTTEAGVAITDLELRMTIKTLAAKGQSHRAIGRQLDLCEGTVRYHLRLSLIHI